MIKILKISTLPTYETPKSGFHVVKTSPEYESFKFIYVKINKGKLLKNFENLETYELCNGSQIFSIIKLINKIKPKILSIHNYKFSFIPLILKLIYKKKITYIYTFHGEDKNLILKSKILLFLFRKTYDKLLTLDYNLSQKFDLNFFPNGLEYSLKKSLNNNNTYFDILFPASFKEVKNHLQFILFAEKYFIRIQSKVRVFFAGDGQLKEKCIEACNKGNNKNIEYYFLGTLSTNDLNNYYSKSSICVLPSKNEGFSKVLSECIEHQKLLVTTPVGSNKYVLGDDYEYFVSKKLDNINDFNVFLKAYENYKNFKFNNANIRSWNQIQDDYKIFYKKIIVDK